MVTQAALATTSAGISRVPARVSCLEEARSIGARRFWAYRRGARRERRRPLRGARGCVLGRGLAPRGQGCQEYEAPVHHGCASGGPRAGRRIRKRVPRRPELHGDVRRPHHILEQGTPSGRRGVDLQIGLRHPKLNVYPAVRITRGERCVRAGKNSGGGRRETSRSRAWTSVIERCSPSTFPAACSRRATRRRDDVGCAA